MANDLLSSLFSHPDFLFLSMIPIKPSGRKTGQKHTVTPDNFLIQYKRFTRAPMTLLGT